MHENKKICKKCGIEKDLDCFTQSKNIKDGYENTCKKCRNDQRKKYINICQSCNKEFKASKKEAKFCNSKCQCCGNNKGHNLNAHHILNYSEYEELRTDIYNGITLCKDCHKLFHDTYGYKNNNYDQLKEFLNK